MKKYPWDEYLENQSPAHRVSTACRVEARIGGEDVSFVVTERPELHEFERDQAVFGGTELGILGQRGRPVPEDVAVAVIRAKEILGGEIVSVRKLGKCP